MKRKIAGIFAALGLALGLLVAGPTSPALANENTVGAWVGGTYFSVTVQYYYYTDGGGHQRVRWTYAITQPSNGGSYYTIRHWMTNYYGTAWDTGQQTGLGISQRWPPSQANSRTDYQPILRVRVWENGDTWAANFTVNG